MLVCKLYKRNALCSRLQSCCYNCVFKELMFIQFDVLSNVVVSFNDFTGQKVFNFSSLLKKMEPLASSNKLSIAL